MAVAPLDVDGVPLDIYGGCGDHLLVCHVENLNYLQTETTVWRRERNSSCYATLWRAFRVPPRRVSANAAVAGAAA